MTVCARCSHQTSLTSGTILHGTRKPLQTWFKAIWWICSREKGTSAKDLQRYLGLGSYQTAWAWLQKLRRAMKAADMDALRGPVEVGDGLLARYENGSICADTFKDAKIVAAVEIGDLDAPVAGRIKMRHIEDFSSKTLIPFVVENVIKGSVVVTDDWRGYTGLGERGFIHKVLTKKEGLPCLTDLQIDLLGDWLLKTHKGAVACKHLQHYLDEFTFRHNLRYQTIEEAIHKIVLGTTKRKATPYWQLVGRSYPDRPLRRKGKGK